MRIWLGVFVSIGCLVAVPHDGEARKHNKRTPYNQNWNTQSNAGQMQLHQPPAYSQYPGYQGYPGGNGGGRSDCPGADSAHNYSGYPCWAQRAFAPKSGAGR